MFQQVGMPEDIQGRGPHAEADENHNLRQREARPLVGRPLRGYHQQPPSFLLASRLPNGTNCHIYGMASTYESFIVKFFWLVIYIFMSTA